MPDSQAATHKEVQPATARADDALRARVHAALADADRLATLEASGLLTHAGREAMDRVARLAARALRVPLSQVNVVTSDTQVPVATALVPADDPAAWLAPVGLDTSYCQYVVAEGRALVVSDATTHPLVRSSRATTEGGVRAYIGVPLRAPAPLGGHCLGSVCVVDFVARQWRDEDVDILEELAQLAAERMGWSKAVRETLADHAGHLDALSAAMAAQLAELEAIYDHAGVGLCVIDTELRWVRINEQLAAMNGLPAESHIGRSIHELLPGLAPAAAPVLRRVLESGEPLLDVELVGETTAHPGEQRVWREHFLPLRGASGAVVGVNIVCEDVTEQRAHERERAELLAAERRAREEAEAASRVRSEFLATMSHELRTPLNAIGGFTELIVDGLYGPVTDTQREALERIRRSQQHLLGLINDVLSYSKIDAQRVHYDFTDVVVREAIEEAEVLVLPQSAAKGVTVRCAVCDVAVVARADGAKLQQILLNLLANAVKFTPSGGSITLRCELASSRVVIRVRDTGIGIPADQCEAIFEPFVQVDSRLTRTQGGTGLGLAISRAFARGMGGELTVTSEPGVGSEFALTLPRGRRAR